MKCQFSLLFVTGVIVDAVFKKEESIEKSNILGLMSNMNE